MTEAELGALLRRHPTLFHMAEAGAWPSIERQGLLSTSALLDLHGVEGAARAAIEDARRPEGVRLARAGLAGATVRDQKPMSDAALARCLEGGLVPADWYRLLNGLVFFWLTRARLERLLAARPYRGLAHDVLEVDAARLVASYRDAIVLSPINSGSTIRAAVRRGPATFRSIDAYDYAGRRGERVVELAVRRGVPDIARFVRNVTRRGLD